MNTTITPASFLAHVRASGVTIESLRGTIITLSKRFPAGDNAAFACAESEVSVIYDVPQTEAGSTWGTDGGSIGGMCAIANGMMRMNRSGCSKRFMAKLAKLI